MRQLINAGRPSVDRVALAIVLIAISAAFANAGTPLQSNLIAAWPFNEGTGSTAFDVAPFGVHSDNGTLRNTPTWISGKFGTALNFNGTDEDVLIPNSMDMNIGTNAVTLSAWVKLDQLPSAISGSFSGIMDSAPDNFRAVSG